MPNKKAWFDVALGAAASLLLLVMMLLTFADVLGRYVFNTPLRGAFEITELALLSLIFAGLPLVSRILPRAIMPRDTVAVSVRCELKNVRQVVSSR